MQNIVIIGGSDAGILATLRAREVNARADVTMDVRGVGKPGS
jgi:hypothetical protein